MKAISSWEHKKNYMFPGILKESDENKSYWKGHVLPEVFQRERKQACKGKGSCEEMIPHLIKGWPQRGCMKKLYKCSKWKQRYKRISLSSKEVTFWIKYHTTHLWRVNFNLSERYWTWDQGDWTIFFLSVMMTFGSSNALLSLQIIFSWITTCFKQCLLDSYSAYSISLSSRSSRLFSQTIPSNVSECLGVYVKTFFW